MGLKDFHLKLKIIRLRRFLVGIGGKKKKKQSKGIINGRRASWMMPVSHGYYHVVNNNNNFSPSPLMENYNHKLDTSDSIVVQREQIDEHELWFFGVFDSRIGDGVIKYMQSHLFNKKLNESKMSRRSKETLRKAHNYARAKIGEDEDSKETCKMGSAASVVINGEKLVIADMGDYKAIVCKDGEAQEITTRHRKPNRRHWSHRFLPGMMRTPRGRIKAGDSGDSAIAKSSKISEVVTSLQRIDSDTEFVILASTGIWEVMRHQEAINLIRHIEDPQQAAECLAKEALTRMSRSNISCLIIRFD